MKSKIITIAAVLLIGAIAILGTYYYSMTEEKIAKLSDNNTKLSADLNTVYKEYVKVVAPKIFKNEEDLVTWLNSVKDQSINGYITQARLDGAYMEMWVGGVDGKTSISGIDFGENWKATKSAIIGVKYALITVVDGKTFIVDPTSKRIISVDLEKDNGTWK